MTGKSGEVPGIVV